MHLANGLISLGITIALASQLICGDGLPTKGEIKRHKQELGQLCKRIGNFKYISQMEELIELVSQVSEEQVKSIVENPSETSTFKRFSHSSTEPCLQQANAIKDLGPIIREKNNVCSSQHLDMIEHYHDQYIKPSSMACESTSSRLLMLGSACGSSRPITAKFFELYANQVAFSCKAHLLASLKTIDGSQLVSNEDYTKALPWLTHSNLKLCEKIEKQKKVASNLDGPQQTLFTQDSPDYSDERVLQCRAVRALSEISTVHELVEASERDKQVNEGSLEQLFRSNIVIRPKAKISTDDDQTASKSGLFIIVPKEQKEIVRDMQLGCSKLRTIYEETVQPIVRLIQMGFNPTFEKFDQVCSENKLIQKWFGITLVCSSILSSHLTDIDKYQELKEDFEKQKSLVVIDKESVDGSAFPSPNSSALLDLLKYPIEDELWVNQYSSTKMQRLKNGVLKKVLKLLKVEDIDDHIVLRRNIAAISGWIVKGVILTVSLITLRS